MKKFIDEEEDVLFFFLGFAGGLPWWFEYNFKCEKLKFFYILRFFKEFLTTSEDFQQYSAWVTSYTPP